MGLYSAEIRTKGKRVTTTYKATHRHALYFTIITAKTQFKDQSLQQSRNWSCFFYISVYSALMAVLFSCFLIYDTQQIMGGKKYSISPEEHVFAAIQVQH